jgi:hypothetical protein
VRTVIVQPPEQSSGGLHYLSPGDSIRFGRGAVDASVDLALPHEGVPRVGGEITATQDYWTLSNFSRDKTYVVENPEGAGEHIKVPPLRSGAPVPFEIARVLVPSEHELVSFLVYAPQHAYLSDTPGDVLAGEHTTTAFPLDKSAKYFLVLVALCEPRLRDVSHVEIPPVESVVERLRSLPGCADLTSAAVHFHIDYLATTKLRVKRPDADDGAKRLNSKRESLVSLALRFNLVREEHLLLLPPRTPRAAASSAPRVST